MRTRVLVDTSALARYPNPEVAAVLGPLLEAGELATCGIVELEVLFSARSHRDLVLIRERWSRAYERLDTREADFVRAADVMVELARSGQHRAAKLPDLLVAAVAERNAIPVVHYDQDFDLIASVTGQECRWVVDRGTID